jgi:UDP-glucose 4-epimerase
VNVEGFVNVVEQAHADGCDTVVYASTSSAYGSRTEPTPEDVSLDAATGYDASMLSRERYAEYYNSFYDDLTAAGMRFFSVYQGYGGAEAHKGEYANLIAQFADDIANGRRPEIWGDGSQTRDFTHVDDVTRAIELAADHECQGIYNVGTGEQYSFDDLVARLNEVLDTDVEPTYAEGYVPDHVYVHDTMADASKLREETGWEPEVDFAEGLRRVCAQYR